MLFLATRWGHLDTVKTLVDHGANDTDGKALLKALEKGFTPIATLLLQRDRTTSNAVEEQDKNTALMLAAIHGNEALVKQLLAYGAKLDPINAKGQDVLAVAAGRGQLAYRAGIATARCW